MGIRQGRIAALVLLFLFVVPMGCKAPKPKTVEPSPSPTAQAQFEKNPFITLLVDQMDAKDTWRGQMAEKLDSYRPKTGETDYSGLAKTALIPFGEADALMANVSVVATSLKKQADGSYTLDQGGTQATLTASGQEMTYAARITDSTDPNAYTRQGASFLTDGSRMEVQVFEKSGSQGEITLVDLQWIRQADNSYMQYYYSSDDGGTYNLIRVLISANSFEFAVYDEVQSMPSLFSATSKEFFIAGYVTRGSFSNNTATVSNENHTLTVGP